MDTKKESINMWNTILEAVLTEEQYYSWTKMLEAEMCERYRDSVRNYGNEHPIFHVSDIQKKRSEGGWSMCGIQDNLLNETLLKYSNDFRTINVHLNSDVFSLNELGRAYMKYMDPEI